VEDESYYWQVSRYIHPHPGSVSNLTRQVNRDRKNSAELRGDLTAIEQCLLPT
jgi:hypothetical protein